VKCASPDDEALNALRWTYWYCRWPLCEFSEPNAAFRVLYFLNFYKEGIKFFHTCRQWRNHLATTRKKICMRHVASSSNRGNISTLWGREYTDLRVLVIRTDRAVP
jgi:hypothetical protein